MQFNSNYGYKNHCEENNFLYIALDCYRDLIPQYSSRDLILRQKEKCK